MRRVESFLGTTPTLSTAGSDWLHFHPLHLNASASRLAPDDNHPVSSIKSPPRLVYASNSRLTAHLHRGRPTLSGPSWPTRRPPLSWTSIDIPQELRWPMLTAQPSGTGYSKLGFAGNDSPSFVFPTAIATKGPATGAGGSGSGRPAVANKPSFLTGGAGPTGHLSGKRGTEDLDFFIGDEALAASAGPGMCGGADTATEGYG